MPRTIVLITLVACAPMPSPEPEPIAPPIEEPAASPREVTLTIVGTNDLHGHLRALPIFAGYLRVLRELREDDGGVVLVDGGDMFQGTLESNLLEGAPVVAAYSALGYDAATVGNHEFDYGPVGERSTPGPGDDPRGALIARAQEARFAILASNVRMREDGTAIEWPSITPSVLIERAGIQVGIIGVTTEHTLSTTIYGNVRDLVIEPLTAAIVREAGRLRERGADVIVVAAHAGGVCDRFDDPNDLSSCRENEEIFDVARALPENAADVIVAGHTHRGVAHVVNGIPIIESHSYGRAFGRVDLRVIGDRVDGFEVFPPRDLCGQGNADEGTCAPAEYEGRTIEPDTSVAALIAPAIENARAAQERPLGVTLAGRVDADREEECALGNLFTDLMRQARPSADVALTNGGGLRADLPAGPLTYGALYEAMPFDNRFATVRLTAGELAEILADNARHRGSFFSISGLTAQASCDGERIVMRLSTPNGRPVRPDRQLTLVTTDFLATGGDGALGRIGADRVTLEEGDTVRDAIATVLTSRGGSIAPSALFDRARPRVRLVGERPMRCP
jgi:2',3'-cyclic-nucleotide 2'-phosphodiesterase (5'-nucleotidase family)